MWIGWVSSGCACDATIVREVLCCVADGCESGASRCCAACCVVGCVGVSLHGICIDRGVLVTRGSLDDCQAPAHGCFCVYLLVYGFIFYVFVVSYRSTLTLPPSFLPSLPSLPPSRSDAEHQVPPCDGEGPPW